MSRARRSPKRETSAELRLGDGFMAPASVTKWARWLVPSLVALVTFAAFLPTLQNQFVKWDDDENFANNPHYRGLAWSHLRWMWTTFHMGQYIPLTWMTLGMDYQLWGMNPVGYHLTSLLLHAANAVVFYFVVLRLLTLALPGPSERGHALAVSSGFAALVFAIHPLRVESVAWVTERRDVLSGLFYLLTILVYLRACEGEERGRRRYGLSVALFACALLSKSMAVSLPVVLLILDVYPLRRLGGSLGWSSKPVRRIYVEKIPFVLLAGAASAMAFKALSVIHNMARLADLSAPGRLAVSAYGLSFYLCKMIVPSNLSPLYEMPPVLDVWAMPFVLSYALVLVITALAVALRRRVPGLLAAWVAYVVILLPVLGIFQNGPQIAADRYTYLAALGWATLAGAGLLSCWRTLTRSRTGTPTTLPLASIAACCVVVALGTLTWNQGRVWRDSERLWAYALTLDPNSSIAHNNLGAELIEQGKLPEAIEHIQQALRVKPDDASAHTNWGLALIYQGEPAEAIEHLQQALRIEPDSAEAHAHWGLALIHQGKPAEAIEHFQEALRIEPDLAEAHAHWGLALARQSKLTEAIEHFQEALRLRPDVAEVHNSWGVALARQGDPVEVIRHFLRIVDTRSELARSSHGLDRERNLAEAIEHYRQALRIKPDYALAHSNWGLALIQQGKPAEAIEHFQEALRIEPELAEAHTGWGVALARQGKLAEAAEHYRQARSRKGRTPE
jgi:tetratricopeptide (TPR) repeat protein